MKAKIIVLGSALLMTMVSWAQNVGDVELKKAGRSSGGYAEKKLKKAPKKVYIAEFRISYQLLYSDQESTQGGSQMGGGAIGSSSASLTVGVPTVQQQDLIDMTDKLYADYVSGLKGQGYEIVSPDVAGKSEFYQDWQRMKGGNLNQAQRLGFITVSPSDYEYYVKKVTGKGKEKSSFTGSLHRLSFEMDNMLIAQVNMVIPFMVDSESGASKALTKSIGGVSKVVASPDFKLSEQTTVQYMYATNKFGAESTAFTKLDKELKIEDVFEDKKYKAVSSAQSNQNWNNAAVFTVWNTSTEYTQTAECDRDEYKNGVLTAGGKFLGASLDQLKTYTTN